MELPNPDSQVHENTSKEGSYSGTNQCKIQITQKINHEGEINRARYMPSNPNLIATRTVMGPVYLFDRTKHSNTPKSDGVCMPDLVLLGHEKEGYGLSWHPGTFKSHLLASSSDSIICHWYALSQLLHDNKSRDVEGMTKESRTLDPFRSYTGHTAWVEDVQWHPMHDTLFASVGDDKQLMM